MRKEFIAVEGKGKGTFLVGSDKKIVRVGKLGREIMDRTPWAAKYSSAEGGFWAFESIDDYETAKRQI